MVVKFLQKNSQQSIWTDLTILDCWEIKKLIYLDTSIHSQSTCDICNGIIVII